MAMSRPLAVAVTAMALLVASVGFEVLFSRTYSLDVQTEGGWVTIGTSGDPYGVARPRETQGGNVVEASRDDNLTFRLRVDNGYPWAFSEAYDVRVGSVIVAEGILTAASRADGESTFQVRAGSFLAQATPDPESPEREPTIEFAYLDVVVGETHLHGNFQLRVVS